MWATLGLELGDTGENKKLAYKMMLCSPVANPSCSSQPAHLPVSLFAKKLHGGLECYVSSGLRYPFPA